MKFQMVGKLYGLLRVMTHIHGDLFLCECTCGKPVQRKGGDLRHAAKIGHIPACGRVCARQAPWARPMCYICGARCHTDKTCDSEGQKWCKHCGGLPWRRPQHSPCKGCGHWYQRERLIPVSAYASGEGWSF